MVRAQRAVVQVIETKHVVQEQAAVIIQKQIMDLEDRASSISSRVRHNLFVEQQSYCLASASKNGMGSYKSDVDHSTGSGACSIRSLTPTRNGELYLLT